MDQNQNRRHQQLDGNTESNSIQTAEVSKTTMAKNKKGEGSKTKKTRTTIMSRSQRGMVDVKRGMLNYMGGIDTQFPNREGGENYNNARPGPPPGYAPQSAQVQTRKWAGLLPQSFTYLRRLEADILYSAVRVMNHSVHPGGPVGYPPNGQNVPVGYAPNGQNVPVGYPSDGKISAGSEAYGNGLPAGGENYNNVRPGPLPAYGNGLPAGGENYNNARPGPPPGYAPQTAQVPTRKWGGLLPQLVNYLTRLETDIRYSAVRVMNLSVHPGGPVGYAPNGQNVQVGYGPNVQNVSVGYAPNGQNVPVGYPSDGKISSGNEDLIIQLEGEPHRFSYNELSMATGGFCEESKLGHGGFGSVYRGMLPSGPVAVKKMNQGTAQSQGLKEFNAEVSIISQVRHRNLIELLGWCEDSAKQEYLVVYELMPNGSLDDLLFKPMEGKASPSWPQRFKILTGTADALAYLHQDVKKQILHRDIKCSNIMLDREWNAKVGDFGIARLQDHEGEAKTTNMAGTMGYIAPEVFIEGRFTEKADVFAFGVVVLEAACGRRVLPCQPQELGLVICVRQRLSEGDLLSTVDKQLLDCDMQQVKMVLMIGLACCQNNPRNRPSMKHVAQMLAGDGQEELAKLIEHVEHEGRTNWGPQVDTILF